MGNFQQEAAEHEWGILPRCYDISFSNHLPGAEIAWPNNSGWVLVGGSANSKTWTPYRRCCAAGLHQAEGPM